MTVKISGNSSVSTPSFAGEEGDSGLHATADQVQLVTNGTVGVTVDSSQNVGVGTTTPSTISATYTNIHVQGTNGGGVNFGPSTGSVGYVAGSASGTEIGTTGATDFSVFTNNTTKLTVDSSGVIDFVGPGYTIGTNSCFIKQDSSGEGYLYNRGNNDLLFGTNNSERMKIQADGTIINYGAVYFNYGSSYSFPITYSSGVGAIVFGNPNTQAYVIYSNSSSTTGVLLNANATAWTSYTSESRLKDILGDVDSDQAWSLVRDIELKRFYYKDQDDKTGVSYAGPMADWLGVQDPELLIDTGRTDDEGPIHTFNQALLDVKALAALSAALKRIETLETVNAEQATTIASFEARISALEGGN